MAASNKNTFGFIPRPVLNTSSNIERGDGSGCRIGPSQLIVNNFFNVGAPRGRYVMPARAYVILVGLRF